MIQKLIEPLRDRLLSLPYIDSYVGLVKPIARQKEDGKEQIIPYSCSLQDDCFKIITPDSSKLSFSYVEPNESVSIELKRQIATVSTSVRLIVWLNLPALGYEPFCGAEAYFSIQIQKWLQWHFHNGLMDLHFSVTEDLSNTDNPFDKYNFDNPQRLIINPYTYVYLTLSITGQVGLSCFDDFEPLTPIECPTT